MSVVRCREQGCRTPIEWLTLMSGKRVPFEHQLVPADKAPDEAWTITKDNRGRARVVPYTGQREVRFVLVRHDCTGAHSNPR